MKKTDVMQQISTARRSCEAANAALRSTANTYDNEQGRFRPTTEEERRKEMMLAWLWASNAATQAEAASRMVLRYCKQNGIAPEEIDEFVRRLREGE